MVILTWVDHLVKTVMIMAIACAALKISIMTHPRRTIDSTQLDVDLVCNGRQYDYRNGRLVPVARLGDHRSGFLPIFLPAWLWAGIGRGVIRSVALVSWSLFLHLCATGSRVDLHYAFALVAAVGVSTVIMIGNLVMSDGRQR